MLGIIKTIAKTDYYQHSLSLLIDYVNRTNRKNFSKEKFDQILDVFLLQGKTNENIFHCGIDLLNLLNPDEINTCEEKFILFTFSNGNSSYYCEELSNIIKSKFSFFKVSDNFIKQFLIHLRDCFYNEDKIKVLFDLIKDKDTKISVLNALGKINPALLTILKV